MKPHRIMGVAAAVACVVVGIIRGSPLVVFFDATCVILVGVGSGAMIAATYGRGAGRLFSAVVDWFFGAESELSSPEEHRELAIHYRQPRDRPFCLPRAEEFRLPCRTHSIRFPLQARHSESSSS